jgi:nitrogen-specific signal transduction histidine kinase/CheY-like chemotaxis protein
LDTAFTLLPTSQPQMLAILTPCQERLKLEEEWKNLVKANDEGKKLRALGQLAGGVAHDYNNLLAIISGGLEMMIKDGVSLEALEECRATVERAQGLSRQILRFAKQEAPVKEEVSMQETVERVGRLMGISFAMVSAQPMKLTTDASELESALINMLTNAREAVGAGGVVGLKVERLSLKKETRFFRGSLPAGEYGSIMISDNGAGIPAELHERLFEPYFTTKLHKSAGLGLARVGAYVEGMGGAIGMQTASGKGTRWQMIFPIGEKNKKPAGFAMPFGASREAVMQGSIHVAVVDDEPALVNLVERLLKTEGYRSIGFSDSEAAYETLRSRQEPFVLVTDAKMPGMSGVGLVKALRSANSRFAALLMSGYAEELSGNENLFEARLEKPVSSRALMEAVKGAQRRLMI